MGAPVAIYLYAISEQLCVFPGCVLGYLLAHELVGTSLREAVAGIGAALGISVAAGIVEVVLDLDTRSISVPLSLLYCLYFKRISGLDWRRALLVIALMLFICSYITYWAVVVDAYAVGDTISDMYLAWPGMLTQWGLSAVAVAALWRPFKEKMPVLLSRLPMREDSGRSVSVGTVWVLPATLGVLLLYASPENTSSLFVGRIGAITMAFLAFALFLMVEYFMAIWHIGEYYSALIEVNELSHRVRLNNAYLGYLDERLEETRRISHDLRQFVRVLDDFATRGDLDGFRRYAADISSVVPETSLRLCQNPSLNAILVFYCDEASHQGINPDVRVEFPEDVPFDDAILSAIVGNLMENAVDALMEQTAAGADPASLLLSVRGSCLPGSPFVFAVDNSVADAPVVRHDGTFLSTKHEGKGRGIASVRALAAKWGGSSSFECRDHMFKASVMLPERLGPGAGAPGGPVAGSAR